MAKALSIWIKALKKECYEHLRITNNKNFKEIL